MKRSAVIAQSPAQVLHDGSWILHLLRFVVEVALTVFLLIYIPWIAIIFATVYMLSWFTTKRMKAIAAAPAIWGCKFLAFNVAEVAGVFTLLGIRLISQAAIDAVREHL